MTFSIGSLVKARGRDWVVLPESDDTLLILRPLGGSDREIAGVLTSLETVAPSSFSLPTIGDLGDLASARMLTNALKLGFRSSAGPFRSFGRLGFDPRPYQFVPLMMALKLDPVRILIADDVGIGKTAEALMIAAELLAQGEINRLAVLCPPHLATQWQQEMASKFGLEAEVVLASTAATLERGCRTGETLFDHYPITVVSTEFIKAERRRAEFLRTAPELIIVDEAHGASADLRSRSSRHQRHELVKALASDESRHLILVTATPHSGNEGAFRSLLALLDQDFANLPEELSGDANRRIRERVARHLVQRRRADLKSYLGETYFPERLSREVAYQLSDEYKDLFDRTISYAASRTSENEGDERLKRVTWWSVLALLRAMASSPAAAAATLRKRAETAGAKDVEEVERIGRQRVLDLGDDDDLSEIDEGLGADDRVVDEGESETLESSEKRLLRDLERRALACQGDKDAKSQQLVKEVKGLLAEGYSPIVYCRFIATADYVADYLKEKLKNTEVIAVSGRVPSALRQDLVETLIEHPKRVLVATDCLSEGINLQEGFDAVIHYDLSWNPTRHEQREGRVDRFGQRSKEVRVITCYGSDNRIDGLVMDVLLRKHQSIRNSLGISIPIPGDPNAVVETLIRGVLSSGERLGQGTQLTLEGLGPSERELASAWEISAERERKLRSIFAQDTLGPDVVSIELESVKEAIGSIADMKAFVEDVIGSVGGSTLGNDPVRISLQNAPIAIRELSDSKSDSKKDFYLSFDTGVNRPNERKASRVDSFISGLASWVVDSALDNSGPAARAGVRRTSAVEEVTTVLVTRLRFELISPKSQMLAEDLLITGYRGFGDGITWLDNASAAQLLDAQVTGNVLQFQAEEFIGDALSDYHNWIGELENQAEQRGEFLKESHRRVREASRSRGEVEVKLMKPLDIIGVYLLLPGGAK
ncbi:helicase-related protein [Acidithrix ferrooxidans]|uniref:RNA polymerase-associated protein RapA n=1 Tax=Acidithrix ferrooxidans TaxID=1280514 RepID=A0A0D8HI68_9ACTN|nr:helicase-related protein [Acidithrix ferrooxidans]KJF17618.1 RNA polymerase-associated protein RapA [Acidithrix ferrooxidans]